MSHQAPSNGDSPADAGDDLENVLRPMYPIEKKGEEDVLEPAEKSNLEQEIPEGC